MGHNKTAKPSDLTPAVWKRDRTKEELLACLRYMRQEVKDLELLLLRDAR